jgi:hypothetical protein
MPPFTSSIRSAITWSSRAWALTVKRPSAPRITASCPTAGLLRGGLAEGRLRPLFDGHQRAFARR